MKPRLLLVRVPGMLLQPCFDLLNDDHRVLPAQDLVSNDTREHRGGMFQAEAGRGSAISVRSTRVAISDTVASYAISHEQGARKKHSDDVAARKGRAARNSRRVILVRAENGVEILLLTFTVSPQSILLRTSKVKI